MFKNVPNLEKSSRRFQLNRIEIIVKIDHSRRNNFLTTRINRLSNAGDFWRIMKITKHLKIIRNQNV